MFHINSLCCFQYKMKLFLIVKIHLNLYIILYAYNNRHTRTLTCIRCIIQLRFYFISHFYLLFFLRSYFMRWKRILSYFLMIFDCLNDVPKRVSMRVCIVYDFCDINWSANIVQINKVDLSNVQNGIQALRTIHTYVDLWLGFLYLFDSNSRFKNCAKQQCLFKMNTISIIQQGEGENIFLSRKIYSWRWQRKFCIRRKKIMTFFEKQCVYVNMYLHLNWRIYLNSYTYF